MENASFYRTIWRWHFYAGLFVMPFILILSITGAIYLFKPQVERWEERAFQGLPMANPVSPNVQLDAALRAFPGARFDSYRLPERLGDAAMIHLALPDGHAMRDVYISPQGKVLGSIDPEARLMELDSKIHGSLLAGRIGGWLVELAACWAIVMVLTGLYLWWPNGRGLAGVLWPRRRAFLRDLHAVTGFWVSGLALVLLITGLPWAGVWGDAFKMARTELGLMQGKQDWTNGGKAPGGGEHAEHDHNAIMHGAAANMPMVSLASIVAKAESEKLAFPVMVKAPGAPNRFGPAGAPIRLRPSGAGAWMVKSEAQNRTLRATITYDTATGKELAREMFANRHPIDQVVGYGIAWHEGQLFGLVNQLIGVATALVLITLIVSGFVMWRRRKPDAKLGAPPLPSVPAKMRGVIAIMLCLAALLPLLALSLVTVWLVEWLVLRRSTAMAAWLGLDASQLGRE
jgi:uncharacterized iron-regulated membrane protein